MRCKVLATLLVAGVIGGCQDLTAPEVIGDAAFHESLPGTGFCTASASGPLVTPLGLAGMTSSATVMGSEAGPAGSRIAAVNAQGVAAGTVTSGRITLPARRDLDGSWHTLSATSAQVVAINANGAVAGYRGAGTTATALVWSNGAETPIASGAVATGMNDHGTIVGHLTGLSTSGRGFIWANGAMQIIEMPGAAVHPTGINNLGVVVGTIDSGLPASRAFTWKDGQFTLLPAPPEGTHARGVAINDHGHVAVSTLGAPIGTYRPSLAWVHEGGGLRRVPGLLGEGLRAASVYVEDLNEAGMVVGTASEPHNIAGRVAYAWNYTGDEEPLRLNKLEMEGACSSFGLSINNAGQVGGVTTFAGAPSMATIWHLPQPVAPPVSLQPNTCTASFWSANRHLWAVSPETMYRRVFGGNTMGPRTLGYMIDAQPAEGQFALAREATAALLNAFARQRNLGPEWASYPFMPAEVMALVSSASSPQAQREVLETLRAANASCGRGA
jgi:probable HAF family extracellular repeat protein